MSTHRVQAARRKEGTTVKRERFGQSGFQQAEKRDILEKYVDPADSQRRTYSRHNYYVWNQLITILL